ncbi:MAG TPA: hypothetical protein DD706_20105 [Nitrospiraceae bacterium]|nr:hypothetical protein [Nitrospiraceae bacterium]
MTQQAKAIMAKTKQIFPNMSKTPQDSGSSFLPILSVSAGFFQVFTRSLKKHTLLKITLKILQDNRQVLLPRNFHPFSSQINEFEKYRGRMEPGGWAHLLTG